MIPLTLSEINTACKGSFFGDPALMTRQIPHISIDTRTLRENALYVPICGDRFDGHDFIDAARRQGALCTLTDHPLPEEPYILVVDTLRALQDIAAWYRSKFDIPVIGITGSVGKTSVKEMLSAVLGRHMRVMKTQGNLNNQTGVPLTILTLEPSHEVAIVEMGTNHFGEIERLSRVAQPTICLLTNIGVAHIEFFGSREGILQGKSEMLHHMRSGGTVIVNGDDDMLVRLPDTLRYGLGANCAVHAVQLRDLGLSGTEFTVTYGGLTQRMHVPAPGEHMVYNALAAVAVGLTLNLTLPQLKAGVEAFVPPAGRMDIRHTERFTILDDTYNANPTSVMAAIDVLEKVSTRRVGILGDMLELGEQTDAYHEVVGAYAARHRVDLLLCVGPNAVQMCAGANGVAPGCAHHFETQEILLSVLPALLQKGDTILVKGSRGMHLERTVAMLGAL